VTLGDRAGDLDEGAVRAAAAGVLGGVRRELGNDEFGVIPTRGASQEASGEVADIRNLVGGAGEGSPPGHHADAPYGRQ
jgi:hypothetical protein